MNSRSCMKSKRLIIALFLALFAAGPAAAEKKAVDFRLDNWDGRAISLGELKGKTVLLTFTYANCSVRCPIITGRLYGLDKGMNSPRDVVYLHVSLDPDKDTPELRKQYFTLYRIDPVKDKRWLFVSGRKDEITKLLGFYGITAKKVLDRNLPEGYYLDFTQKVVVIGRDGLIRSEAGADFSEEGLAKTITRR